ncbi:MAG TPA: hypothetical protein VHN99_08975 [Deinococcales bacterium]|nr:hypothetical protein [Deinococcales bacterium]
MKTFTRLALIAALLVPVAVARPAASSTATPARATLAGAPTAPIVRITPDRRPIEVLCPILPCGTL